MATILSAYALDNRTADLKREIWDKGLSNKGRIDAIRELFTSDSETAFHELEKIVRSSENDELRLIATTYLGRYKEARIKSIIIALLKDRSRSVREEAVNIAGSLRIKESYTQLVELLNDESSLVRIASIMALGNIGNKDGLQKLVAILDGSDTLAKLAAIPSIELILCQIESVQKPVLDKVISRLDDPNEEVRKKACYFVNEFIDGKSLCLSEQNALQRVAMMMNLKTIVWSIDMKRVTCKELITNFDEDINHGKK